MEKINFRSSVILIIWNYPFSKFSDIGKPDTFDTEKMKVFSITFIRYLLKSWHDKKMFQELNSQHCLGYILLHKYNLAYHGALHFTSVKWKYSECAFVILYTASCNMTFLML